MSLRIGLDFDNTVIRYDEVFRRLAARRGWLPRRPALSKEAVKARLIAQDGHDRRWQALQAEAYGKEIMGARLFPGCLAFLRRAARAGHEVFVVSHKSKASHFDPSVKLRDWALRWLRRHGRGVLRPANVRFAGDRDAKVRQLAALRLDLFIDDLLPVLAHPGFPRRTARLHLCPNGGRGGSARVSNWGQATAALDCLEALGPEVLRAIESSCGQAPLSAERAARRGNNSLWRVTLADGRRVLVKRYLVDSRDRRERGATEFRALRLLWDNGIRSVPEPVYVDPRGAFGIMAWIDGRDLRKGGAGGAQVRQAADFIRRVAGLKPGAFPEASDSRRRLADYVRHIERRLAAVREGAAALKGHPEARRFLAEKLIPLKERLLARFFAEADRQGLDLERPLPARRRILSPSDFGFHNALEDARGRLVFLDFEYFGQDDPAKLACDFCHHVGFELPPELRRSFVLRVAGALPEPEAFLRRVDLVYGLIGLEWVLIVLNVLAPHTLARRRFADPGEEAGALIRRRLRLARRLVARLEAPRPRFSPALSKAR